ncbi:MAG TPA: hypothetical protein VLB50_06670 [Ignavibacteriaceae bacterium]|nr:hypothetical protein [Ignavibacteriaceae bacterium]
MNNLPSLRSQVNWKIGTLEDRRIVEQREILSLRYSRQLKLMNSAYNPSLLPAGRQVQREGYVGDEVISFKVLPCNCSKF